MQLKIDPEKTYAIVLEGGGAKGSYQIGAWKALNEAGIRYNAVSGSSVGSLNGAFMAMRDYETAETLWKNLTFSRVMNVDDTLMEHVVRGQIGGIEELMNVLKGARNVLREGGFDVEPLRKLLSEVVDEEKVRASDVNFYIMTYSLTDHKPLDIDARKLEPGTLGDMLMASAYFPAFKHEKLGGKSYTDGGVTDVVPIHALLSRGYRDIIMLRIFGVGKERRVKIPGDAYIVSVEPRKDLGSVLDFAADKAEENMRLGYFDTMKVLYGLKGKDYYIESTYSEQEAYSLLKEIVFSAEGEVSLRELNEKLLPEMAGEAEAEEGDYTDVLTAFLEKCAQRLEIDPFRIYTDSELLEIIRRERRIQAPPEPGKLLSLFPLV